MTRAAAVPFSGRAKWGEVAADLVLAAGGSLLLLVAAPQLSGREPVGLWLLVLYTGFAVAVTLVLACVVALTSQLPSLGAATVAGRPAEGVRSWAAPWWHANALDLGLAVTGVALAAVALAAGGSGAVVAAVPGLVGLWFLARVGLVLLGRRRRPAMWLTADEVVLDSPSGRARAPRDSVRQVRCRGQRVVVELNRDAAWTLPPRPWRRRLEARDTLVLDCSDIAHRAPDLAHWLAEQVEAPFGQGSRGNDSTSTVTANKE